MINTKTNSVVSKTRQEETISDSHTHFATCAVFLFWQMQCLFMQLGHFCAKHHTSKTGTRWDRHCLSLVDSDASVLSGLMQIKNMLRNNWRVRNNKNKKKTNIFLSKKWINTHRMVSINQMLKFAEGFAHIHSQQQHLQTKVTLIKRLEM